VWWSSRVERLRARGSPNQAPARTRQGGKCRESVVRDRIVWTLTRETRAVGLGYPVEIERHVSLRPHELPRLLADDKTAWVELGPGRDAAAGAVPGKLVVVGPIGVALPATEVA
jgi:hypothetical protein